MRILEAFGEPISYGGQESFVMNVLEHMDRSGMDIDLLTPYYCDNPGIADKLKDWGCGLYSLEVDFRPGSLRGTAKKPIARFLSEHKYDVIHIHSGSNSMLEIYAKLAHRAGIRRIIVHSHSTGRDDWKHAASSILTSYGLRRYPTDYCACSVEAGKWRFPADICCRSLHVISDGIYADSFRYDNKKRKVVRAELNLKDDIVLVGVAGRLSSEKNQRFMMECLKDIGRMPDGWRYRLILIGDGADRKELAELSEKMGISDRVIFTGFTNRINDYYQAIDVLTVPSLYEGFGMVVVEGQAAGLDVIVSDRVPKAADLTGSVTFLPLEDNTVWIDAIMSEHERHPENADIISASTGSIRKTVSDVMEMYSKK